MRATTGRLVTIHCPKTPETVGMFNAARLARMKPTAYLVNMRARRHHRRTGLHAALSTGKLPARASTSTRKSRSNPTTRRSSSPTDPRPHMAGVTKESLDRMGLQTAKNILSALDGKPIRENVINQEVLD